VQGTWSSGQQVAGRIGGSLSFNGSNDYIQASGSGSLNLTNPITLEAWVKESNTAATQYIFSHGNVYVDGYCMGIDHAGLIVSSHQVLLGPCGGGGFGSTATIADTNWHHLVGVVNGSSSSIYIDGVAAGTGTVTAGTSTNSANIGVASTYWLNGYLDEVRVSNIARSSDWIITEYHNQNTPTTFYSVGAQEGGGGGGGGVTTTITTAPTGLAIAIDGTQCTAPCTFQWSAGSSHSIGLSQRRRMDPRGHAMPT
jgi:hypothetical protein